MDDYTFGSVIGQALMFWLGFTLWLRWRKK